MDTTGLPPDTVEVLPANVYAILTDRQCTATNRAGTRCQRYAIRGGTVCYMHGGAAPQVKAAAHARLVETRDLFLQALHDRVATAGDHLDPKLLLEATERLTKLTELLEGRATDRHETTVTHTPEQIRQTFIDTMDQLADKISG